MQNLTFGIEIETIGRTRNAVAKSIQQVVGGRIEHIADVYDTWQVVDNRGRAWQTKSDASLSASRSQQAEVVSPILRYEDMDELQEVVRSIRRCGAKVDASCGIHIHVGSAPFDAKALTNLVKMVNKQERLIEYALGVSETRRSRWCRSIDESFIQNLERRRPRNLDAINAAWYGRHNNRPQHYDSSRYRGVNLHSVWFRGTIEFRWFDATLHAGKVKAYIQFILALANKALSSRSASSSKRTFDPSTAKYDFRVFLLRLGMIGDEFKTARLHLLSRFEGSSAWKHGRPAQTTNPTRLAA